MPKNKEVDEEKYNSLETCFDIQKINELLKNVVFDLHNFYKPSELCHPDQLVHFPQARKSSELIGIPCII